MKKDTLYFLLFFLPGFIGVLVFFVLPFVGGIYYMFISDAYPNDFVGFANLMSVLDNDMFRLSFANTLWYSTIVSPVILMGAFSLACWMNHFAAFGGLRVAMLLPYVLPTAALVLIWKVAFAFGGPVNQVLSTLGVPQIDWLNSIHLRVPVTAMFIWRNLGFLTIILFASIQTLPSEYYQYAKLEGASVIRQHLTITFPLILPMILFAFLLSWTGSFKIFKEIYALAGGYPDPGVYMLQHFFNNQFALMNYGVVTSAAYIFAALVGTVFIILFSLDRKYRNENSI